MIPTRGFKALSVPDSIPYFQKLVRIPLHPKIQSLIAAMFFLICHVQLCPTPITTVTITRGRIR